MRSRFAGLQSLDSSFQLVDARTPSSRGMLESSTAWLAILMASPRFMDTPDRVCHRADPGRRTRARRGRRAPRRGHAGGDGVLYLLVEAVGEPLEEEHREDVVFVVGRINLPPRMSAACHSFDFNSCLVSTSAPSFSLPP